MNSETHTFDGEVENRAAHESNSVCSDTRHTIHAAGSTAAESELNTVAELGYD
jgi:hypothetical protein